jgi:hypothetical protein
MLGATTISINVVSMTTLSGWITFVSIGCLWILAIAASDTLGEVELIQV